MLSFLSPEEVGELRGYLERCVEGLERENRREGALPLPDYAAAGGVVTRRPATARARGTTRRSSTRRRAGTGGGTARR